MTTLYVLTDLFSFIGPAGSDERAHEAAQALRIERFFESRVRDFGEEGARPRRKRASGQKAHARGVSGLDARELVVQLHAGHRRHHEIAEDQVELLALLEEAERRAAVGRSEEHTAELQ